MKRLDTFLVAFFFLSGILTRFPFVERMQSHIDSASFSLALIHYSFEHDTPAPPGYPLYLGLGKLFMLLVSDPHISLVLVSVFFSGIGAAVFFLAGKSFGNRATGIISTLLFLSAPTFYFFGLTIYPYLLVAVMTVLLAWCVFEIAFKKKQYGILLGAVYALCIGIRPQELLTTLPIFLYGLYSLSTRQRSRSIATFLILSFLWFLPFLAIVGGISSYVFYSSKAVSSALPLPNLTLFFVNRFKLASGFFLTFGAGSVILVMYPVFLSFQWVKKRTVTKQERKKLVFFAVWFIPPLLFNLIVRTEHAGYQMGYLTCLIFLFSSVIWTIAKHRFIPALCITSFVVAINLILFFYNRDPNHALPYRQSSFHYSDLRRNDYEISKKRDYVRKYFSDSSTLLLLSPVFWKQYAYHLPEYTVLELNGLYTNNASVKYQVREDRMWQREEYQNVNRVFSIPKGIEQLVFLDDEVCEWKVKGLLMRTLEKNICISWLKVQEGEKFSYADKVFFKKE